MIRLLLSTTVLTMENSSSMSLKATISQSFGLKSSRQMNFFQSWKATSALVSPAARDIRDGWRPTTSSEMFWICVATTKREGTRSGQQRRQGRSDRGGKGQVSRNSEEDSRR